MIYLPLDHNFPEPILDCLDRFIQRPKLIPLRRIHPDLARLRDRELLIALSQLGYKGLVTNDYRMLRNPGAIAAVLKTKLTVFAIEGVGHDPIRATGALLLDLPAAVRGMEAGSRGVFWLRPRNPRPVDPWDLFKKAAERKGQGVDELYSEVKVTDEEIGAVAISGV